MPVKITKNRDYRPHSEALNGAHVLLRLAAEQPKGCYYQWMGSLLLSAFAFEGYMNFLGRIFFPSWGSFERRLSWQLKLTLLGDTIGLAVDPGREPFQTIKQLFRFRDEVAHPKPCELTETYQATREEAESSLKMYEDVKAEVEIFCCEVNAKLCIERVEEMMQLLYSRAETNAQALDPDAKRAFIQNAPWVHSGQSGSSSLSH